MIEQVSRRVLIIGAGVAGELLRKDIMAHHAGVEVVGFIDDSKNAKKIVGKIADLSRLVGVYRVDELLIAIPSADGALVRSILLANLENQVPIRIVPRVKNVLRMNEVRYDSVKEVEPDDFLGRPIVKRRIGLIDRFYKDKVVLVTGGAGSIGSDIVRQLLEAGVRKVIVYDNSELLAYSLRQQLEEQRVSRRQYRIIIGSILDKEKLLMVLKEMNPELVFHVAAYKHVHLMEENVDEAVATNVLGTANVVRVVEEASVPRMVFVSTDKVVNPTSVMGATKSLAERIVLSRPRKPTCFSVVRFGNVINSNGSVLPLFERQIKDHNYVTLTDFQMERFFMSIREAAELVLASATRSSAGAVYVLDMGDLILLREVAECVIRAAGLRPGIDVELREIGKRQGEKLQEELFTDAERSLMKQTSLSGVSQLRPKTWEVTEVAAMVEELRGLATYKRRRALRAYLKEEFSSLER